MAFRVEINPAAERDAESILEWLMSEHAGETGWRWFARLREAVDSLAEMPERCPIAPESTHYGYTIRELFYGRKPHVY